MDFAVRAPTLFTAVVVVFLAGCAGYRLGPTNGERAGVRSVQVNPFQNETEQPRLGTAVTHSIRQRLQQDGTYELNTRNRGDIVVNGTIVRYRRSLVSSRPEDIITPRDYLLVMTARVTATERATGRTLLNREVAGRTTVRVGPDLTSLERQAVPLMAEDLARRTTALLVEGSW